MERWRQASEAAKRFDVEREELLRAALKKMKRADVVELTLCIAQEVKASEWTLESEIELDKPVDLLVNDIEIAIEIATRVDEQQMNRNPKIDWRAYDAVQRGLSQLIRREGIEEAKALALNLMQKGSFQIECSDEGLMYEEIESCLRPVISAVAESSAGDEWALKMLRHNSTGFVCRRELTELAGAIHNN